ncbi:hypothetical protein ACEN9J_28875 [Variovorax sp. Varisp41]|uniref:hypothetical protein n=1 Tax=Variovorax sp. Varisp41 TaxID=3243033 RepID=UPI0039B6C838
MSLAAPAERRGKRMQRLAGALAFCGLAAGTVVAVRDECPPETGGRGTVRRTPVSTLAPIMEIERAALPQQARPRPGQPFDSYSPAAPKPGARRGAGACRYHAR